MSDPRTTAPVPSSPSSGDPMESLRDRYRDSDHEARDRLPSREQIEAITDIEALQALRDDVDFTVKRIETDLEFSDGTDEWARRAMLALTAHKVCVGQIDHHVRRLRRGGVKGPASTPNKDERKAAKHSAHALRLAAEAERKRADTEARAIVAAREIANVVRRTSWLAFFHAAAVRSLDPATISRLSNEAHAVLLDALSDGLSGATKADGPASGPNP